MCTSEKMIHHNRICAIVCKTMLTSVQFAKHAHKFAVCRAISKGAWLCISCVQHTIATTLHRTRISSRHIFFCHFIWSQGNKINSKKMNANIRKTKLICTPFNYAKSTCFYKPNVVINFYHRCVAKKKKKLTVAFSVKYLDKKNNVATVKLFRWEFLRSND